MSRDRARQVRAVVRDLSTRAGTEIRASFEAGTWRLEWSDGPTPRGVMSDLATADLAAEITIHRSLSARAVALGAIRLAAVGGFAPTSRRRPADQVEAALDDVEHPELAADDREEYLAERLLAEAEVADRSGPAQSLVCELLAERGLGWLVTTAGVATPLEVLTARYATGPGAVAWRERAEPMPVRVAVEAALADSTIDTPAALATLGLLKVLRAEQERAEAHAAAAARRTGATWTQIGAALGITKQSAAKWAANRTGGVSSRTRPSAQG